MTLQDILTPEITAVLGTLLGSGGTALINKWQNKKKAMLNCKLFTGSLTICR